MEESPRSEAHSARNQSHLSAHRCDLSLVHARFRHHVGQRAAGQVLHHHEELVSHQETGKKKKKRCNATSTACFQRLVCSLGVGFVFYLSTKLTMLGFFSSFITRISLMMSSFFGCFCKLICLMATCVTTPDTQLLMWAPTSHDCYIYREEGGGGVTSCPVATSMAVYTVPDALEETSRRRSFSSIPHVLAALFLLLSSKAPI